MLASRGSTGMPTFSGMVTLPSARLALFLMLAAASLVGCGGHGSGSSPPNNPIPSLAMLTPSIASAGGVTLTLTVNGSGFVAGSVVNWNGTALPTTFVSSTQLTASVPAGDIGNVGTAQITVTNPTPGGGSSAQVSFAVVNPVPAVTSLSQASSPVAGAGFNLTVTGSEFVAGSVVRWNGSDRTTAFGSATQLTVTIPASDLVFAGMAQVTVANPTPGGGSSTATTFTIQPQISNGAALAGSAASLARDATTDMPPVGVGPSDVQNGVIMNRLDVRFAHDATVGQVNDALASVGAGIVSMSQGFLSVTVGIPEQSAMQALLALITHLEAQPGVALVTVAAVAEPQAIFPRIDVATAASLIVHLLPTRFPAAWNVAPTTQFGNPQTPNAQQHCPDLFVRPVLVPDYFATPFAPDFSASFQQLTSPEDADPGVAAEKLEHGGLVILALGGNSIGANPFAFSGCMDVRLTQMGNFFSWYQVIDRIVSRMPVAGRFVANFSIGFHQACAATPCDPVIDDFLGTTPLYIASAALYWKEKTRSRWQDFLWVNSAGNDRDEPSSAIYPGFADSRFDSPMAAARVPDPLFQWTLEDRFWRPSAALRAQGFFTLEPTATEVNDLDVEAVAAGMDDAGAIPDNIIVVGSVDGQDSNTATSAHVPPEQLQESAFSEDNPDVRAVGNTVFDHAGTSFAAPQIAGLVNFLWMISDELSEQQPVGITKRAILANARNGIVDAYATVLSLDPVALPTAQTAPMRLTLLDVNQDSQFDEADVDQYLRHYYLVDANGALTNQPVPPAPADFGRYDLNGDGFTGGGGRERFDLDRVGSMQYGTTLYLVISQNIEGSQIGFDETAVTDLEVLCYYAYSPLYVGDPDARRTELEGRCGLSVQPLAVNLVAGATQQFSAVTPGNDPVNWSATCGSISNNGLYTAGSTAGSCTVRATNANDPTVSGAATVNVTVPNTDPFFFDFEGLNDLQGWIPTPANADACLNHAYWTEYSEGSPPTIQIRFAELDGTDPDPNTGVCNNRTVADTGDGKPNSSIRRTLDLPASVTLLEFDAAGHNRAPSDASLRVRVVDSTNTSHTVLDWITILGTQDPDVTSGGPPFLHHQVNIAEFAGQRVTVFFEQGDNGPGSNEQVGLDNIWFH